jgi:hypothetical protein
MPHKWRHQPARKFADPSTAASKCELTGDSWYQQSQERFSRIGIRRPEGSNEGLKETHAGKRQAGSGLAALSLEEDDPKDAAEENF